MKKCDIIIPVWNELDSTKECLNRLKKHTQYPYRLIIIDNGSTQPVKQYLESLGADFPEYLLIRNSANLGFVKAVNQGMISSENRYVCLLNNDVSVTDKWLTLMIETVEAGPKNIGAANPTSNDYGEAGPDGEKNDFQELDYCKGFCILIKKEIIGRIGLFDEVFGMGYFEEKDFCRRVIKAGFLCIRAKSAFVMHKDRLSFDKLSNRDEIFEINESIYNKKWGKPLSIAFVIQKERNVEKNKKTIYELLDKGHRVNIFFRRKDPVRDLKDHINIKYFPLPGTGFGYFILFKLWGRRRKKKIEVIIAEDGKYQRFFERFKFMHEAEINGAYEEKGA